MTRTRKILVALALAVLTATPVVACMGVLDRTEIVMGGVLCTYRLSNGQRVQVMYRDRYSCPFCME